MQSFHSYEDRIKQMLLHKFLVVAVAFLVEYYTLSE